MTDPELDALVRCLRNELLDRRNFADAAADAITTLRAQLAEARAERGKMGRALNVAKYGQPDFAWEIHKMAMEEAVAQRDRAEAERDAALAALAAQIEADAGIVAEEARYQQGIAVMQMRRGIPWQSADWAFRKLTEVAKSIRSQPTAPTALDRMLRAEREKALREAVDKVMLKTYRPHAPKDFRDGYDVAKADVATAIFAMTPRADRAKAAHHIDVSQLMRWGAGKIQSEFIATAIRAQPHDRTTLDRMLRAEREKALREAADLIHRVADGYDAGGDKAIACGLYLTEGNVRAMVKQEGGE